MLRQQQQQPLLLMLQGRLLVPLHFTELMEAKEACFDLERLLRQPRPTAFSEHEDDDDGSKESLSIFNNLLLQFSFSSYIFSSVDAKVCFQVK